jgi:hypothetical protein
MLSVSENWSNAHRENPYSLNPVNGVFFSVISISFSSHIIAFALVKIDTHPWSVACPTDSNGVFTFNLFANLAFSGRFKLNFPFDFPIIKPPVHDRNTLIPFCVAVLSSKGRKVQLLLLHLYRRRCHRCLIARSDWK